MRKSSTKPNEVTPEDAEAVAQKLIESVTAQPVAPEFIVTEDGICIDPESGEVLDVQAPEDVTETTASESAFAMWLLERVQTRDAKCKSAMQVMNRCGQTLDAMWTAQGEEFELNPEVIRLRAQFANAEKMHSRADRERVGIATRFDAFFQRVASTMTAGTRGRTWETVFGALSLRKSGPTIAIDDMDKAVALAEALGLGEKVKKSVNMSDLKPSVLSAYATSAPSAPDQVAEIDRLHKIILAHPGAVSLIPSKDTLTISTGI